VLDSLLAEHVHDKEVSLVIALPPSRLAAVVSVFGSSAAFFVAFEYCGLAWDDFFCFYMFKR